MSQIFGIPQGYITDGMIKSVAGSKLTGNAPANFVTAAGITDGVITDEKAVAGEKLLRDDTALPVMSSVDALLSTTSLGTYANLFTAFLYVPSNATNFKCRVFITATGSGGGAVNVKFTLGASDSNIESTTSSAWVDLTLDISAISGPQSFVIKGRINVTGDTMNVQYFNCRIE